MFIVSENMYNSLRVALLEHVRDKEPFVHVQAVAALAKICGSEDLEELGEGEQTVTEVLEDLLAYDPSACVSPTLPSCSPEQTYQRRAPCRTTQHSYHGSNPHCCTHLDA